MADFIFNALLGAGIIAIQPADRPWWAKLGVLIMMVLALHGSFVGIEP